MREGRQRTERMALRYGVAYLFRYREISLQAHARYLDATLFKSLMAGAHCLHGRTDRDIRSRLTGTRRLRACTGDPRRAGAKAGRCFRRLHMHRLIAKIPRTRR